MVPRDSRIYYIIVSISLSCRNPFLCLYATLPTQPSNYYTLIPPSILSSTEGSWVSLTFGHLFHDSHQYPSQYQFQRLSHIAFQPATSVDIHLDLLSWVLNCYTGCYSSYKIIDNLWE